MKMKRAVKAVMCGMALMGMLSMEALPVQAAGCSHKFWNMIIDADKGYSYEVSGHYKVHGTLYVCADCGMERWEDLQYDWVEDHEWSKFTFDHFDGCFDIYKRECMTSGCGVVDYLPLEG